MQLIITILASSAITTAVVYFAIYRMSLECVYLDYVISIKNKSTHILSVPRYEIIASQKWSPKLKFILCGELHIQLLPSR